MNLEKLKAAGECAHLDQGGPIAATFGNVIGWFVENDVMDADDVAKHVRAFVHCSPSSATPRAAQNAMMRALGPQLRREVNQLLAVCIELMLERGADIDGIVDCARLIAELTIEAISTYRETGAVTFPSINGDEEFSVRKVVA